MLLCPPLSLQSLTVPQGPWQLGPHSHTAPLLCTKKSKSDGIIIDPPAVIETITGKKKQKPRFKKSDLVSYVSSLSGTVTSKDAVGSVKDLKGDTEVEIELEAGMGVGAGGGREGGGAALAQPVKKKIQKPKKPIAKADNNDNNYPHNDNEKENMTGNSNAINNEHNEKEFEFDFEVELSNNSRVSQFRTAILDDGNGLYARKSRLQGPGSVHFALSLKGLREAMKKQNRISVLPSDGTVTSVGADADVRVEGCVGSLCNSGALSETDSMVVEDVTSHVMDCSEDLAGTGKEEGGHMCDEGDGSRREGEKVIEVELNTSNMDVQDDAESGRVGERDKEKEGEKEREKDHNHQQLNNENEKDNEKEKKENEKEQEQLRAVRRRVLMNPAVFKILKAVDIARDVCEKQIIAENEAAAHSEAVANSEISSSIENTSNSATVGSEIVADSGIVDRVDVGPMGEMLIEESQPGRLVDVSGTIDASATADTAAAAATPPMDGDVTAAAASTTTTADAMDGGALQGPSTAGISVTDINPSDTLSLDSMMCLGDSAVVQTHQIDKGEVEGGEEMDVEVEVEGEGEGERVDSFQTDSQESSTEKTHTYCADIPSIQSVDTQIPLTNIPPLSASASISASALVHSSTSPPTLPSGVISVPALPLPTTLLSTLPSCTPITNVTLELDTTEDRSLTTPVERMGHDKDHQIGGEMSSTTDSVDARDEAVHQVDVDTIEIVTHPAQGEKHQEEQIEEQQEEQTEEQKDEVTVEQPQHSEVTDLLLSADLSQPSLIPSRATSATSSSHYGFPDDTSKEIMERPWVTDSLPILECPSASSSASHETTVLTSIPSIISPSTCPPSLSVSPPVSLVDTVAVRLDDSHIDSTEPVCGSMRDKEDKETVTHFNTDANAAAVLSGVTPMDICEENLPLPAALDVPDVVVASDVTLMSTHSAESITAPSTDILPILPIQSNETHADDISVSTVVSVEDKLQDFTYPRAIKTLPPVTASGIPLLTGWRSADSKTLDLTFQTRNQISKKQSTSPVAPKGGRGKTLDPSSALSVWHDYRRCCLCSSQNSEVEHSVAEVEHFDMSKFSPRPLLCGFINNGATATATATSIASRTFDDTTADIGSMRERDSSYEEGDAEHKNGSHALPLPLSPSPPPLYVASDDPVCGRLLPLPDGSHAHANCLRWSADVVERGGLLLNALSAKIK
jgi:hypothetical protein